MKHTKGPWRIGRPNVANGVQIFSDSDYPLRSDVICIMPDKGKGLTANARLIAAAPDLLEACKEAYSELNQLAFLQNDKLANSTLNKLQQAISKAEGNNETLE